VPGGDAVQPAPQALGRDAQLPATARSGPGAGQRSASRVVGRPAAAQAR
jgi:hypothetical protein